MLSASWGDLIPFDGLPFFSSSGRIARGRRLAIFLSFLALSTGSFTLLTNAVEKHLLVNQLEQISMGICKKLTL